MKKLYAVQSTKGWETTWIISHSPNQEVTVEDVSRYLSISEKQYLTILMANGAKGNSYYQWFSQEEACLKCISLLENNLVTQEQQNLSDLKVDIQTARIQKTLYCISVGDLWAISFNNERPAPSSELVSSLGITEEDVWIILGERGADFNEGLFEEQKDCFDAMKTFKQCVEQNQEQDSEILHLVPYGIYRDQYVLSTLEGVLKSYDSVAKELNMNEEDFIKVVTNHGGKFLNDLPIFNTKASAASCVFALSQKTFKQVAAPEPVLSAQEEPVVLQKGEVPFFIKGLQTPTLETTTADSLQGTIHSLGYKQRVLQNCIELLQKDDLPSLIEVIQLQQEESDDVLRHAFNSNKILLRIAEMLEPLLPETFTVYADESGLLQVDSVNNNIVLRYKQTDYFAVFRVSLGELQHMLSPAEQTLQNQISPLYEQMRKSEIKEGLNVLSEINQHLQVFEEFKNAKTDLLVAFDTLNVRWSNF